MRVSRRFTPGSARFDEDNLVSHAGLVPLLGLVEQTVAGGHGNVLRQTVIAVVGGRELAEHENPGEATLVVLHGRVRLSTAGDVWGGHVVTAASLTEGLRPGGALCGVCGEDRAG